MIPSEVCSLYDFGLLELGSGPHDPCIVEFYGGATCPDDQCCRDCPDSWRQPV